MDGGIPDNDRLDNIVDAQAGFGAQIGGELVDGIHQQRLQFGRICRGF